MIRPILQSDIPQILRIEKSVHIVPWTEETFKTCFRSNYPGWLIEIEGKIIGFVIVSFAIDECHILNVCIEHAHQRQGHGRKLLEHALSEALKQGMSIAYLEVRRSNVPAITLYQKMNFHLVGERKGYYPTVAGEEDALIFAMQLDGDK